MNLLIESFEGGIYLAYKVTDEQKQLIKGSDSHPMRFLSLDQVKDYFRNESYSSATLVHNNAYDEMCGENDGNSPPLEIALNWH